MPTNPNPHFPRHYDLAFIVCAAGRYAPVIQPTNSSQRANERSGGSGAHLRGAPL
jgi:hypothetical protein